MSLSVGIVDAAEISRKGLAALLRSYDGFRVLAEAKSFDEILESCRSRKLEVVLIRTDDLSEEERQGMSELRKLRPEVNLFVIASRARQEDAIAALKFGARGFMTAESDTQTLLAAIRSVAKGEVALSRSAMIHLVDSLGQADRNSARPAAVPRGSRSEPRLTAREVEVLAIVSSGASNRAIAEQLVISEHTVRAHLRNILDKLGLENRVQAATWAAKAGLAIPLPESLSPPVNFAGAVRTT